MLVHVGVAEEKVAWDVLLPRGRGGLVGHELNRSATGIKELRLSPSRISDSEHGEGTVTWSSAGEVGSARLERRLDTLTFWCPVVAREAGVSGGCEPDDPETESLNFELGSSSEEPVEGSFGGGLCSEHGHVGPLGQIGVVGEDG